jgi:hypothetical protein
VLISRLLSEFSFLVIVRRQWQSGGPLHRVVLSLTIDFPGRETEDRDTVDFGRLFGLPFATFGHPVGSDVTVVRFTLVRTIA